MTLKEKAVSVIRSLDDDATIDEMIDRLYLLRKVELGLVQADRGDVQDHHEFMAELELEMELEMLSVRQANPSTSE
ncbi:MAG: hypothetical protein J5I93_18315 [Pirellulaceae bacterium]|nr:hypothetical protein [Pirellulaceae bacterium]